MLFVMFPAYVIPYFPDLMRFNIATLTKRALHFEKNQ